MIRNGEINSAQIEADWFVSEKKEIVMRVVTGERRERWKDGREMDVTYRWLDASGEVYF